MSQFELTTLIIGLLAAAITILDANYHIVRWLKTQWQNFRASNPNKQHKPIKLEAIDQAVAADSRFYIPRPPIETDACQEILAKNALLRIKGARKSGKTSLLNHITQAAQANNRIVSLNLSALDPDVYQSSETFYYWFCQEVSRSLKLDLDLAAYWDQDGGAASNAMHYFEEQLLPAVEPALLITIDEADYLFRHESISQTFFKSLRAWHESANSPDKAIWKKFRLILLHSKPRPQTLNNSPFEGVGFGIEIPAFNQTQIKQLLSAHGLRWRDNELAQMYQLLGGQPYLWRLCLYQIINNSKETYQSILDHAGTDAGIFSSYLHQLENQVERAELHHALYEITHRDELNPEREQLKSLGLVEAQPAAIVSSCQLYQDYFKHRSRR